jgi:hypothetical protein
VYSKLVPLQTQGQSANEGACHHRWNTIDDVRVDPGGCCFEEVATCALVHVAEHRTTSGVGGVWARHRAIEATQGKLRGGSRTRRREVAVRTRQRGAVREPGRRESVWEPGCRGLAAAGRGYAARGRPTSMSGSREEQRTASDGRATFGPRPASDQQHICLWRCIVGPFSDGGV